MKEQSQFDLLIDRTNTDCLKHDFAAKRGKPEGLLSLWVADMDFKAPEKVIDAIVKRADHGIFGYTEPGESYFEAVSGWMKEHHSYEVHRNWLVKTPGIVYAIAMAVQAFTKEGDAVLIQTPVYYPFSEVVKDNHRRLVDSTLVYENGRYEIDFVDFEHKIIDEQVKLFILCSPHNPVGRVWTTEELTRLAGICVKHQVIVVSDEIHQDFVYGSGKHTVFSTISKDAEALSVVCTAPSKTFNLAGLQVSNVFIANTELRHKFKQAMNASGYSQLNTLGLTACEAAYRFGGEWHASLLKYLEGTITLIQEYLATELPEIKLVQPDGTYLIWLDCKSLGLSQTDLNSLIVERAGLWLDGGEMFGAAGEGFQRVNITSPRSIILQALEQLKVAIREK